jgi:hypothetical protein
MMMMMVTILMMMVAILMMMVVVVYAPRVGMCHAATWPRHMTCSDSTHQQSTMHVVCPIADLWLHASRLGHTSVPTTLRTGVVDDGAAAD